MVHYFELCIFDALVRKVEAELAEKFERVSAGDMERLVEARIEKIVEKLLADYDETPPA